MELIGSGKHITLHYSKEMRTTKNDISRITEKKLEENQEYDPKTLNMFFLPPIYTIPCIQQLRF